MKYEKEQLEQIHVHDLRGIGRELGVKAPTKLKKKH